RPALRPHRSAPGEARRSSLAVRGRALVDVLAALERVAKRVGERARLAEAGVEPRADDALRAARREWATGRDALRQRARLEHQAVGRVDAEHEPEPLQLRRAELAAGADDLQRSRATNQRWQSHRTAGARESAP